MAFVNSSTIKRKTREKVFAREGGFCHWCGKVTFDRVGPLKKGEHDRATLDHLYPRTDIRRQTTKKIPLSEKCVNACYQCNVERGNMTKEQWDEVLTRRQLMKG